MRSSLLLILTLAIGIIPIRAQGPKKVPDQWLNVPAQFPVGTSTNWLRAELFTTLHAEALIGQLKIYFSASVPTNAAVTLYPNFFWDGRASSLEAQAVGPIANPIEMGNTHENAVKTVAAAFFGVRRQSRHEQDTAGIRPVHIAVGVIVVLVYYVLL